MSEVGRLLGKVGRGVRDPRRVWAKRGRICQLAWRLPAQLGRGLLHPRRSWGRLRELMGPLPATEAPAAVPAPTGRGYKRLAGAFGVNATGYLHADTGVGEGIRADIRMLKRSRLPFVVNDIIRDGEAANLEQVDGAMVSTDRPFAINLVHVNADQAGYFAGLAGPDYFRDRYTIAFWAWELSEFPEAWQPAFQCYDEIWCQTTFVADAVARCSPVPVVRIPFAVPERLEVAAGVDRSHFGLREGDFVFLFTFDYASFVERKNPLALIEAFSRAFPQERDVVLLLKTSRGERNPEGQALLQQAAAGCPVRFLDASLPRPEINSLVSLCDCFVSLHRSEGFGAGLAEAMVAGKPVIATAYSGNMDFMNVANSFPVKYRLVEIERDCGPYRKGRVWAEADLGHAAAQMRLVYDDRELARRVGELGREQIVSQLGPVPVASMARKRLLRIASRCGIEVPDDLAEG